MKLVWKAVLMACFAMLFYVSWCQSVPSLGWYGDDFLMVRWATHSDFFDFLRTGFASEGFNRQVGWLVSACQYNLWDKSPLQHQVLSKALHLVNCLLVFLLARVLLRANKPAFVAASLYGLLPTFGEVVFNPICIHIQVTKLLLIVSFVLFARWLRRGCRHKWPLTGALFFFALCMFGYEQAALASILFPLATALARKRCKDINVAKACAFPLVAFGGAVWSVIFHAPSFHQAHPEVGNIIWKAGMLLSRIAWDYSIQLRYRLIVASSRILAAVYSSSFMSDYAWVCLSLVVSIFLMTVALRRLSRASERLSRRYHLTVIGLGTAFFLLSYFIFLLRPAEKFYIASRNHYIPSLGLSIAVAAIVATLDDSPVRLLRGKVVPFFLSLAIATVLAVFALLNFEDSRDWVKGGKAITSVLESLKREEAPPPPGRIFVVLGCPKHIGTCRPFGDPWILNSAVRFAYDRSDIFGVTEPRIRADKLEFFGRSEPIDSERIAFYRFSSDTFELRPLTREKALNILDAH